MEYPREFARYIKGIPLRVSPRKVSTPRAFPSVLKALVVPIFPLPDFLMSLPLSFPRSSPVGMLPSK